jgi:hypothetical protein
MDTLTREQAHKLAEFISTIRPDWGTPGVVKALSDARTRGDVAQVAQAAVRAAATPTNRTPAIIALPGPHWQSTTAPSGGVTGLDPYAEAQHRRTRELSADHLAGDHRGTPTPDCPRCAPAYAEVTA